MFWKLWSALAKDYNVSKKEFDSLHDDFKEHKKVVQYQKNCEPIVQGIKQKIESVAVLVETKLESHNKQSELSIKSFNKRIDDLIDVIKKNGNK